MRGTLDEDCLFYMVVRRYCPPEEMGLFFSPSERGLAEFCEEIEMSEFRRRRESRPLVVNGRKLGYYVMEGLAEEEREEFEGCVRMAGTASCPQVAVNNLPDAVKHYSVYGVMPQEEEYFRKRRRRISVE